MRLSISLLILLIYFCEFCCFAFQCSTSPLSKQVPEYTVCTSGNQTDQPHNEIVFANECRFLHSPPFIQCHSLNPTALCWQALDSNGSVEVAFPILPQGCHYTSYEAILMVYETSDLNCFPHRFDLKIHSRKRACIVDCLETSCLDQCIQRGVLTFQHVFSGCYQLILTPYQNQQPYTLHQMESAISYLDTRHVKTPIQSDTVLITNVIPARLSLQATFPTVPTSARFKLMQDVDKSLGPEACRKTGICIATCDTLLGSRHIQCASDDRKANVSCNYQSESVVSCEFSQLKAGNYCVRLSFDDDRCNRNTIWDNNDYNYSMCAWQTDILEILPAEHRIEGRSAGPISSVLLTLLIIVVLACCGVTWWILHHRIDSHNHKFSPILTIRSQVPEHPKVLLLYARDCPKFLEAVAQLRTVLKRACDCEVMDCWEDGQYESVAPQGPSHWLMSHLSDSKVRTVLVTSPASLMLESGLVNGSRVSYHQPKAFDCVISQALTSLHETYSLESYKSLFIVRLDSRTEGITPQTRTFLNPLTTYELPVHLNALLANLQNMNPTECRIPDDLESDVDTLRKSISEYRQYLSDQPHYLDSLLTTNNGTVINVGLD